jgi:hypothetical protein
MTEIVLAIKRARLPRVMTAIRPKSFGHPKRESLANVMGPEHKCNRTDRVAFALF